MPRINLAKLVTLNQGMEGEGELGSGGCGWHAGTKVSSAPAKIPGELRHWVEARVARHEHSQLFHIKDHTVQIVKSVFQFFENQCLSTGRTYYFQMIYF